MLESCSPVQGFGSRRRGVEVCGCGVVAAVTLILLVCFSVYVKIAEYFTCIFIKKTQLKFTEKKKIIIIIIILIYQINY